MKDITKRLAILSGKGGVGKSTISVNIAKELQRQGYTVGLFDADIDCPNIPQVAGLPIEYQMKIVNDKLIPYDWEGIDVISLAWALPANTPILLDGTQKQEVIDQIIRLTEWKPTLDYLIIDCPAGTGSVLFAVLHEQITGAIIVTTPHAAAIADAIRAKDMLLEYQVPLIGIINNMAYIDITCPECHSQWDWTFPSVHNWTQDHLLATLPYTNDIMRTNIIPQTSDIVNKILNIIPKLKEVKFYESKAQKLQRAAVKFSVKVANR